MNRSAEPAEEPGEEVLQTVDGWCMRLDARGLVHEFWHKAGGVNGDNRRRSLTRKHVWRWEVEFTEVPVAPAAENVLSMVVDARTDVEAVRIARHQAIQAHMRGGQDPRWLLTASVTACGRL